MGIYATHITISVALKQQGDKLMPDKILFTHIKIYKYSYIIIIKNITLYSTYSLNTYKTFILRI